MPVKILLNGAKGRMGRAVTAAAGDYDSVIQAAIDLGDDPAPAMPECDVVMDFSLHDAAVPLLQLAAKHTKPVVIGATGHTPEERNAIAAFAQEIPVIFSGNFSAGVNLLFHLTAQAAGLLGSDYHPEIVEMHHRNKKDAPSGTARHLADIIRETRGLKEEHIRHGREGHAGERPDDEIGVHALRGGDVTGEHTVIFAGPGERLELTHKAGGRRIFAQGALRAARWLLSRPPGLYDMQDVLQLR